MKPYDYLIVGSGLFGAVFAHEAHKAGKRCLVIEKRPHTGGNIYCEEVDGINVHKYGAHIFHTDNREVWNYVNRLVEFNRYTNSPIANYKGKLYNLPFNMNTFYQLWGVRTPAEARAKIQEQCREYEHITHPQNLEEQALKLCGKDIYRQLIKGYTEKQWGRPATELPAFIIRRIPFRFIFDNNYFNDPYQGIPMGGYNRLIGALLENIEVRTGTDYMAHRKELERNGENPVYLYGYGGFNINLTPGFSPLAVLLMEQGGIYAVANLRGGGEFGERWHRAGMLSAKQNVFDDFIAAAEYLIDRKYTAPHKLAIAGGSNGGLLVGACMVQRPDLFAVALPAVGVMDMLRYHKFTVGWGWVVEYGSSDRPADFEYLYRYSPLHNIRPGTCYPATLVTTADHDDRVVPAHSFKFAATLQAAQGCDRPVLIRIDTAAGHGLGKPTAKRIDEQADVLVFLFRNTGTEVK